MLEILIEYGNILRNVGAFLDTVVFGLINNAYDLIYACASAVFFTSDEIRKIMNSIYVIVGIFALFKVALLLVNSIINPDKLFEKGSGIGNVLVNVLIMFVILVATPIVFQEAYELQRIVVEGHYVEKIFINTDTLNNSQRTPGDAMKDIIISSLIPLDENIKNDNYNCGSAGKEAIEEYLEMEVEGFEMYKIAKYASVTCKTSEGDNEGEKFYVYDYNWPITLIAAGFITYILFSFAIDIAVRSVELAALQLLAPLFIATYVDPKSAKSGPFNKWLTTVGKTFASLFIKIGIISIMLLLFSLIDDVLDKLELPDSVSGWGKILLLIGILIFAKKAPKWIGDMIGVEGGVGELGIGKKMAGAAFVGGAISKGLDSAKNLGKKKGKNFLGNRVRNTAARAGGMKEAYMQNKKNGINDKQSLWKQGQNIWKQGSAAAKNSRSENWGKDTDGFLKAAGAGYMAGRMNLNPSAESLKDKIKANVAVKATKYNNEIGNTPEKIKERVDAAKKLKKASEMRTNPIVLNNEGKRDTILDWQGYNEFKTAIGDRVMTEEQAYRKDLQNIASKNNWDFDETAGIATTSDGRKITWEQHKASFTGAGQADVTAFVTKNFQTQSESLKSNVELRVSNDQKIAGYEAQIAQLKNQGTSESDPAVLSLKGQITQLQTQNETINKHNVAILSAITKTEEQFVSAPHKCPTAVQVGDEYVTAAGKFIKDGDGFTYVPKQGIPIPGADVEDNVQRVAQFNFDPTTINAIINKVATIAGDKDAEAKAAHDELNPKSS